MVRSAWVAQQYSLKSVSERTRPLSRSSFAICEIVAPSAMVTVTSASGLVRDSTSSAQRHANTASSTDAASTQHTYSSTRMPDGSRPCFFSSAGSGSCGCWSTVRSAYSSGIFGSNSGGILGVCFCGCVSCSSSASACVLACSSSSLSFIIASTRARSSLTDASSSSSESDSRLFSSPPSSGDCPSGRLFGVKSAMCSSLMRGRQCRRRPDGPYPHP